MLLATRQRSRSQLDHYVACSATVDKAARMVVEKMLFRQIELFKVL